MEITIKRDPLGADNIFPWEAIAPGGAPVGMGKTREAAVADLFREFDQTPCRNITETSSNVPCSRCGAGIGEGCREGFTIRIAPDSSSAEKAAVPT